MSQTIRYILENLSGISKECEPRMSIDEALLDIRELVGKLKKEDDNLYPIPETIYNQAIKDVLEMLR